jgi:catechol 2,3-dioxygenase-like lactoylglutathione lyase family enzyme
VAEWRGPEGSFRLAILSLDHINIRTAELERTRAFFTEVLGLTVGWRPDFPFAGAWLYAGDRPVVHLVEVARPAAPSSGSALDHFAFAVDDFDATVASLRAHGFAFEPAEVPGGAIRQLFITELNGVTVELNCRTKAG